MNYVSHVVITSDTITDSGYHLYACDCSSNNIILSLNDSDSSDGSVFYIKRIDTNITNTLTIDTTLGNNIDNMPSIQLSIIGGITDPNKVTLTRIGSNWFIMS